jgi:hypothetical protein
MLVATTMKMRRIVPTITETPFLFANWHH